MPERIQRSRVKGSRMPKGAIYVGRPTRWGNPFVAADGVVVGHDWATVRARNLLSPVRRKCGHRGVIESCVHEVLYSAHSNPDAAVAHAVDLFGKYCSVTERDHPQAFLKWLAPLRGRDLACWCRLVDEHGNRVPCHADVLLELANQGEVR